jgi:hypothetical protein
MSPKWIALALLPTALACETGAPTEVNPDYTFCLSHREETQCAFLREWCAEHPDDPIRCLDASMPDAGVCCTDATVPADAKADACRDCSTGCSNNNECASNEHGQYCSPARACVQCLENAQCSSTDPVCSGNKCVGCTAKSDCSARSTTPACDVASGDCVECTAADATKCTAVNKVCKSGSNTCTECNTSADCTDPTKPTCEANVCRACAADNECTGKMNAGVALDACWNGQCVDCRVDAMDTKKDYGCAGNAACNPVTRTCSDRMKNSANTCSPCLSDAECTTDHRCVEMSYQGTTLQPTGQAGGYCLALISAPGDCPAPYGASPIVRSSRSGATMDSYCGVNETKATCEGIRAFGTRCPDGMVASCNAIGARCENVNGSMRCTYSCASGNSAECPETLSCASGSNSYCGQN